MNYIKIHDRFISHFKTTTPRYRLEHRNILDVRLYDEKLYTESHHIIPKHSGGSNDYRNLVDLLPEEHLFIHMLRYKAYKDRNDFLAVRQIINGFDKHYRYDSIRIFLNKKIRSTYGVFKSSLVKFRKENGWHTQNGIKRISKARKNKIPVVDLKGNSIGSVDKNHPNILSGLWKHHSKGMHSYININTMEKIYCPIDDVRLSSGEWKANQGKVDGFNNPRYSNITDEELENFYFLVSKICKENFDKKYLPPLNFIREIWSMIDDRKYPNLSGALKSGFRFNGNINNLYSRSEQELGIFWNKTQKYYSRNIDIEKLIERIKNVNN